MYYGKTVIDVHGHMSSPPHFRAHAYNMIALRTGGSDRIEIPEAAMKQAIERHLRIIDACSVDIQLISPRPVAMMHWERPFLVESWTRITNNVIADQCRQYPKRFRGVAQLPQTRDLNIARCVTELERCVQELGFVGAILNPDPGADRSAPGLNHEAWFPLYAAAEKLQATLVVHPSISHDPRLDGIPHSYQYNNVTEETLATLLLEQGDVFKRFPTLKIVVCHCGGAGRRLLELGSKLDANNPSRGDDNVVRPTGERGGGSGGPPPAYAEPPDVSANLFFDTCCYDPWSLGAAIRQRGVSQMVFGTEAPGSGSAQRNPLTGRPAEDVLALIETLDFLTVEQKIDMVHNNPRRVFPLLEKYPID